MSTTGIAFLHEITVGQITDANSPDVNFISATSTAVGDFEGWYIFTDTVRQVWRSTDTGVQKLVFKADVPVTIDTFAIIGHNFSENAVITLSANTINDFTSPPISLSIPWSEKNIVFLQDLGFDFEYYELSILDPTNACGFIEIGKIAGGQKFQFNNSEDITDDFTIQDIDFSQQSSTEGFNRPSNTKIVARTLNASISGMSTKTGQDDNYQGLKNLKDNVRTTRPFLVILDPTEPTFFNAWVQFSDLPAFSFGINRFLSTNFTLNEVF